MEKRRFSSVLVLLCLFGISPLHGQSIITMKEGYGLLSKRNELLIVNCQDIIKVRAEDKLFFVKKNNRFGLFNGTSALIDSTYQVAFEYDSISEIHWRDGKVEFFVKKNGKFGAINSDGQLTLQLVFDTLFRTGRKTNLTIAGLNKKLAVVPEACTLEGSAELKFDYDEILPELPNVEVVSLRKGNYYAFASIHYNKLHITKPMFDLPVTPYQDFFVSSRNDTTYYMYSASSFDKIKEFEFKMNLLNKTVLFNLVTERGIIIPCSPRISMVLLVYPYIYFGLENPADIVGIHLEHSYNLFRSGELVGEFSTFKLRNPDWDGGTNVPKELTFLKVRTPLMNDRALECIYNLNKDIGEFSYVVESGKTLTMARYSTDYFCANVQTVKNHRSKAVAYFKCDDRKRNT